MSKEDEAREALADLILSVDQPDLNKYMPARKPTSPWYRPNKGQAIFGWIVGAIAILAGIQQTLTEWDGKPLAPFIIGIVAIAWSLGYRGTGPK